jgi:cyclopropane-fatty-acyl-phospholipid synthase
LVHGITLSVEQKAWAEARTASMEGASFALTDYRDVSGHYDAVVSIEMAEAVGRQYWPAYLAAIARALKPGGRAALQVITFDDARFEDYASNVDFIQRYIFPGGLLIRTSEFRRLAATNGLDWRDQTAFGLDYAETLKRWRENFEAAAAGGMLPAQFDARFVALWRYYLMYCEGGFRGGGIDVVQATLVKER